MSSSPRLKQIHVSIFDFLPFVQEELLLKPLMAANADSFNVEMNWPSGIGQPTVNYLEDPFAINRSSKEHWEAKLEEKWRLDW
jgi:hypothetical protein